MNTKIIDIVDALEKFIIKEEYKDYDPYDILNSPLFNLPILRSNKFIRFGSQQVFRRIPFNFRPILGIKKEINPVTLGLCIQSFTYLSKIKPEKKDFYYREINNMVEMLMALSSRGYSGYCWGYNFDWEARYSKIPKFMPTAVATGIITNALYEYYKISNDRKIIDILLSSSKFIVKDLFRSMERDTFCFSYSPNDKQKVYNATMKAARLLSQVYNITKIDSYKELAVKTVQFVINNQNPDGSWFYSKGDARTWIDNFHTAYVLDALDEIVNLFDKKEYQKFVDKGIKYYLNNLFTKEGYPKYYSNSFYPIDATEVSQSIITLTRFNEFERANNVIGFALNTLYSGKGYFYHQKNLISDKTPFIRWSNGWFLLALSLNLFKK